MQARVSAASHFPHIQLLPALLERFLKEGVAPGNASEKRIWRVSWTHQRPPRPLLALHHVGRHETLPNIPWWAGQHLSLLAVLAAMLMLRVRGFTSHAHMNSPLACLAGLAFAGLKFQQIISPSAVLDFNPCTSFGIFNMPLAKPMDLPYP